MLPGASRRAGSRSAAGSALNIEGVLMQTTTHTVNKNLIGGAWRDGADIADDINPSNTQDVVGRFVQGDASQVSAAVVGAKEAFPAWSLGFGWPSSDSMSPSWSRANRRDISAIRD